VYSFQYSEVMAYDGRLAVNKRISAKSHKVFVCVCVSEKERERERVNSIPLPI